MKAAQWRRRREGVAWRLNRKLSALAKMAGGESQPQLAYRQLINVSLLAVQLWPMQPQC
jgi:hypothetical protein